MNDSLKNIYRKYMDLGDEIWDNQVLSKVISINNQYGSFFSNEDIEASKNQYETIEHNIDEYKKRFKSAKYYLFMIFVLPLAIILIIPAYFAFKKALSLIAKKVETRNYIFNLINEKINFNKNIVSRLNLINYFKEINQITKYIDCGPLNKSIVKLIRENSKFKLINDNTRNTLSSSWGIFDNDKIVIKLETLKFSLNKNSYHIDKNTSEFLFWEEPIFDYSGSYWFFMTSCNELDLKLNKTYPNANKIEYLDNSNLENKDFNKMFKWEYNNPIDFRMVFTPFTQEYYVKNSFNLTNNKFNNNFNLRKINSFISNKCNAQIESLYKYLWKQINNWKLNLDYIDLLIKSKILDNIHSNYINLTPGWILPILKSEHHNEILLKLKQETPKPDLSTFHYVLNKLISKKVIKSDTDTFHNIVESYKFETNNQNKIYGAKIDGLSFRIKKVEINKNIYSAYAPISNSKYLFISYIKNKWRKVWYTEMENVLYNKEFDEELTPIIKEYINKNIYISIDKSILAVYSNKIEKEDIIKIFERLISIIKKYN